MITVVDVCRDMKIETDSKLTWAVGGAMRRIYEAEKGHLPPKGLRVKTSGRGSHCFAIYPEATRPDIERLIRYFHGEKERQASLL